MAATVVAAPVTELRAQDTGSTQDGSSPTDETLVAQDVAPAGQGVTIGVGSAGPSATVGQRLNPTGRAITLTLPAKDGQTYLGDVVVTITPDDRVEFSAQRLIDVLGNTLDAQALDTLRNLLTGKTTITPADLAPTGLRATYSPQTLELVLDIPAQMRATRTLAIAPVGGAPVGNFVQPAKFAAYLNTRASIDYVHKGIDPGLQDPIFFLDGAAWLNGLVAESEAIWQPGANNRTDFQRLGSRLVYDDMESIIRWTAGDLRPVGQGFQSLPDIAGLSLFRSYGVLEPQRLVRPAGDQSFNLVRPSTVEIRVNGQLVRRLRLDPGTYNLRDFPFSQGSNDIAVFIEDDTGQQQTLRFNTFFDQTQLAPGLSEFGLFTGVKAPIASFGPDYQNEFAVTGFYRRGFTQSFTGGANFQADGHAVMGGIETVMGTSFGTIGTNFAVSHIDGAGDGLAATVTYQRLFQFAGGEGDSINLALTARSKNFGPIGVGIPNNPYSYEASVGYAHAFNEFLYTNLSANYLQGRGLREDLTSLRASIGYRLTADLGVTLDGTYRSSGPDDGLGAFVSLIWRMSPTSTIRSDYTTRNNQARLGYQALGGTEVGSYNVNANIERSDDAGGLNGTGTFVTNRAELGASHFTSLDPHFGNITDQRTSLRAAAAFAVADGAMTVGRPVNQAFAIVKGHPSLEGADVIVDPRPEGYSASTGALGTALKSDLAAYAPETITIDAPSAPPGYDLGTGSFRVLPPYRAGYRLEVGSDYSVTAIGRLVGANGEPVALLAGRAIEEAHPEREPVTIFTNAQGRFGATGLRPGRWRIEMPTEPASVYRLDIPENAVGAVRAGDLTPMATGN